MKCADQLAAEHRRGVGVWRGRAWGYKQLAVEDLADDVVGQLHDIIIRGAAAILSRHWRKYSSVMEKAIQERALPAAGALEMLELRLLLQELRRVEDTAAGDQRDVMHLVQHLVIDDPFHEEAGDESAV